MSGTFSCPECGAQYTFDQVAPGQTFACGACNAAVTAPEAPAAPAPTAAPSAPRRAAGGRPAAKRGAPAARGGAGQRGPARGGKRPAPAAKGPNKALLFGGIGGVVLIGIIVAVAMSGGGGDTPNGTGGNEPAGPTRIEPKVAVQEAMDALRAKGNLDTADGLWTAWESLQETIKAWENDPQYGRLAASILTKEAIALRDTILDKDPDFALLREMRKEKKYDGSLANLGDAVWLSEVQQNDAKELHEKLNKKGGEHGWLKEDDALWAQVTKFEADIADAKAAHEELKNSPFYAAASSMEQEILDDLAGRFEADSSWKGATMHIIEPYVFFVQNDAAWDTLSVAKSRSRTLLSLQDIILHEWKERLDLKPLSEPVPVLMFRGQKQYDIYSGNPDGSGALAHFEPNTGRMAIHDQCDHNTVMHEGTHQLFFAYIGREAGQRISAVMQSYWFQEGMAEWYGNAKRNREGDHWIYNIGTVDKGRMHAIERSMSERGREKLLFTIKELLPIKYADKPKIGAEGRTGLIYAQSWFLIFFFNRYNVDAEGYVHPDKPGIYKERWERYVAEELKGRTGPKVFMEAMELSEDDLKRMEKEYWRFFWYVTGKINAGEISDDKDLIPWHEYEFVNRRGEKITGEKKNDLLPAFDPKGAPAVLSGS